MKEKHSIIKNVLDNLEYTGKGADDSQFTFDIGAVSNYDEDDIKLRNIQRHLVNEGYYSHEEFELERIESAFYKFCRSLAKE